MNRLQTFKHALCAIVKTGLPLLLATPVFADDMSTTNQLLTTISNTTYSILDTLNKTPVYIQSLALMASDWINPNNTNDTSTTTSLAENESAFATLATANTNNHTQQINQALNLTKSLVGIDSGNNSDNHLADTNSLAYQTLMGQLVVPLPSRSLNFTTPPITADTYMQSYLINAAGTNLALPKINTLPNGLAKTKYQNLYNTLTAIQSYSAYLISSLYNPQPTTDTEAYLEQLASSPPSFNDMNAEPLGFILRKILMYTAMNFVQMNKLLHLQQQQVAAQAMANVLTVANMANIATTTLEQTRTSTGQQAATTRPSTTQQQTAQQAAQQAGSTLPSN